jgi:hypothetical protein
LYLQLFKIEAKEEFSWYTYTQGIHN